jgi:hypothetical protein
VHATAPSLIMDGHPTRDAYAWGMVVVGLVSVPVRSGSDARAQDHQ